MFCGRQLPILEHGERVDHIGTVDLHCLLQPSQSTEVNELQQSGAAPYIGIKLRDRAGGYLRRIPGSCPWLSTAVPSLVTGCHRSRGRGAILQSQLQIAIKRGASRNQQLTTSARAPILVRTEGDVAIG
eukprot:183320-Rhodomonas_salina.1